MFVPIPDRTGSGTLSGVAGVVESLDSSKETTLCLYK